MKPFAPVAAVWSLLIVHALPAQAQTGTRLLYSPINARTIGIGFSGTADNTDPSTVFFNPANVVAPSRVYLVGSNERYEEEFFFGDDPYTIRRGDGGGSWKFDPASAWTFGANVAYAKLDDHLDSFFDFDEDMVSLALGAGVNANDKYEFRFGAGIKRLHAKAFDSFDITMFDVDGYAYDVGIATAAHGDATRWNVTPQFGVALIDAGPDIDLPGGYSQELPTRVAMGTSIRVASPLQELAGARVPFFSAIVNLDGENPLDGDPYWDIGAEISFAQILFVRSGVVIVSDDEDASTWGAGVGMPIQSLRVRFDYSQPDSDFIEDQMSLLLVWVF